MRALKTTLAIFSAVLLVSCSEDNLDPKPTPTPPKPKAWSVVETMPTDVKKFIKAQVVTKDLIVFNVESQDEKPVMHKTTDGGATWEEKWADGSYKPDFLVTKNGKGWSNSQYGGLKFLNSGVALSKKSPWGTSDADRAPGELASSRGKVAYLNDDATEGIMICADRTVHKLVVDPTLDPKGENVNRVKSDVKLYEKSGFEYKPYTDELTFATSLDENNVWGSGFVKDEEEKYPLIIFKSNGGEWTEKTFKIEGQTDAQLTKLAFADGKTGFGVVTNTPFYGSYTFSYNMLYKTVDGGSTWTKLVDVDTEITSVAVENDKTAYYTAGNVIYRTTDGGTTWKIFYKEKEISQVAFKDGVLFGFGKDAIVKYN